mmetsp:Transcript_11036/g.12133  ORF Transcript_11036/g.12133 Transcript_11036/m.12133 type:complete len:149 (-) Transcript_11036:95-541(-)|eukprot:CAMPEP_0168517240 /NCGR_PEP_ID=MMETSP0405-20121227/5914_1 /TAXON_ID=498012 /ORGANISM="Trichosphaerium sp, Strain Am-I-7 wt" /LENGTH=148 /DNA_ID=CAMNT_0008537173 /DNA_START=12 /DNA_END=458 /DNA_ORIENTATION=+
MAIVRKTAIKTFKRGRGQGLRLFEATLKLEQYGLGKKVVRKTWYPNEPLDGKKNEANSYWLITRVKPTYRNQRGNFGQAWGIKIYKGVPEHDGEERRITTADKKGWMLLDDMMTLFPHRIDNTTYVYEPPKVWGREAKMKKKGNKEEQ